MDSQAPGTQLILRLRETCSGVAGLFPCHIPVLPKYCPENSWRRRKEPSMPSNTRPSGICGRPWPSRRTSTICWGSRPPAGIRSRRDSAGDAAITFGHYVQKCRVWGGSPTSIFSGLPGPQKSQGLYAFPACR